MPNRTGLVKSVLSELLTLLIFTKLGSSMASTEIANYCCKVVR
nr:MAG TPA: hypothetical protein [Caudoviricetes sp.]